MMWMDDDDDDVLDAPELVVSEIRIGKWKLFYSNSHASASF